MENEMNERIQELKKEAFRQTEWEELDYDRILEKFGELIVQECLGIVNRYEYSYHEADPLWETAQLIKEHFGVEE
jgi:hypothetical protein